MLRAYKYALFPSEEQRTVLEKTFGCCRLIYNTGLETKNTVYRMRGLSLEYFELNKQLTDTKKEVGFLNEVPAQALKILQQ